MNQPQKPAPDFEPMLNLLRAMWHNGTVREMAPVNEINPPAANQSKTHVRINFKPKSGEGEHKLLREWLERNLRSPDALRAIAVQHAPHLSQPVEAYAGNLGFMQRLRVRLEIVEKRVKGAVNHPNKLYVDSTPRVREEEPKTQPGQFFHSGRTRFKARSMSPEGWTKPGRRGRRQE